MPMVVQHYRKIKTGAGLLNVAAHNERRKVYDEKGELMDNPQLVGPWLHPEHQRKNKHSHRDEKSSVLERRSETIKLAKLARRPQKNASFAVEANFSFSPEYCSDWATNPESMKKVTAYFAGCNLFLKERFGAENIIQMDVHFDEKTPHMHAILVPIITKANGEKVYSSASFLGGRAGMIKLQDDFAKKIGSVMGLERGVEGSKARHTDQAEWSAKLKAKEEDIENRERIVKKAEALVLQYPNGAILKEVATRTSGLSRSETDECWKAMKVKGDEIRAARSLEESQEKGKRRGR